MNFSFGSTSIGGTANIITSDDTHYRYIREIARLEVIVKDLENQIEKLQESPAGFTKKEVKILIQKLHPDKTNGSAESNELFNKILAIKNAN